MSSQLIIPHEHTALARLLFGRPPQPIPEPREHNILDSRPWASFMWHWVNKILRRGFDRVIVPEDIPFIPLRDRISIRFGRYKMYMKAHPPTPNTHYREIWAVLYAIRWRLLFALMCKVVVCACQIGMSVIERKLIEEAQYLTEVHGDGSHGKVTGYTIGTCALDTILLMCDMMTMYLSIMNAEYARTLAMSCIHDKMLRLGPQQRHDFSAAKIMTITSSDCRRACIVFYQVNALIVLPLYLGATIGILIYMIGVSGLPGVGILLLGLVISFFASYYAAKLRMGSMPYQDRRVSLTRETLKNINIIKFYGWEKPFWKIISKLRGMETRFIRLLEMVDAFNIAVLLAAPNLGGALSFAVKIIISSGLPAARAFPSLTLFQIFTPILAEASVALTSIADAVVAARRLDSFFRLPEVPSYIEKFPIDKRTTNITASIENGTFSWVLSGESDENSGKSPHLEPQINEKESSRTKVGTDQASKQSSRDDVFPTTEKEKIVLANVDVTLYRGTMNLVIGSVGTGKTSLLNAFVNAIPKTSGIVRVADGIKASSVLSLWSQNCTIRENILFGCDFVRDKYDDVVRICDLEADFRIFAHGDQTEVGENGVSLSGGQRARLALARCLYADGDLVILDDVLSAMDARVGNHIYRELLELAHNRGKTILFSTNNLKLAPLADWVLLLDGSGGVQQMKAAASPFNTAQDKLLSSETDSINSSLGRQEELEARRHEEEYDKDHAPEMEKRIAQERSAEVIDLAEMRKIDQEFDTQISKKSGGHSKNSMIYTDSHQTGAPLIHSLGDQEMSVGMDIMEQKNETQMDDEERSTGTVKFGVVIRYFRFDKPVGLILGIAMLISVLCFATSQAMSNVVLNWWTSNRFIKSSGFNLGMYTMVVSLIAVFYAIFANLISVAATASSTTLHNAALGGLFGAPMLFFQKNPLGRLMMRFTQDLVNLDTQLLIFARLTFMSLFQVLASVIVVFVYIPWVILCLVPIFALAFVLMSFYRTTAREINRCMQLFNSRGMASLSEHIDGQEVIVAFDQVEKSQHNINDILDDVVSATLHNEACNFWMAIRGGLMCELINLVTIFLACFQVFNLNASQVGTLISILPSIRNSLTLLFPMYALFDNQLNSVERLDEYAFSVPAEGAEVKDQTRQELDNWSPINGRVEFNDACLRYRPNLPLVLNDFNIAFEGGRKIGICGRTGAGKSTIITALFRLVELASGTITIDGQNITQLPLEALRRALSIIPQSPVLFQGTVRSNLDPFDEKSDEEITDALHKAGLTSADFGLAKEVEAEGTNFSLGQRQMLALARVILRDSKILILDEATAAVDQDTDSKIQETLKSVFKDCTVLCIAHRLETIMDYDEILVMGPGGVKLEMGTPRELYEKKDSVFKNMCDEAGVQGSW